MVIRTKITLITVTVRGNQHIIKETNQIKSKQNFKSPGSQSHSCELKYHQRDKSKVKAKTSNHLGRSHSQVGEGTCTGNQHTCLQQGTSWDWFILNYHKIMIIIIIIVLLSCRAKAGICLL